MSLRVWLPLDGDLRNLGVSNITVTNDGATIDNNGKIGKCYSFNGNNYYIALTGQKLFDCFKGGTTAFSICMWVYHADTRRAILFGDYGLSNSIGFNIELNTGHSLRFYWNGSPDYSPGINVGLNTWSHITLTYDGASLKSYLNGNLIATRNGTLAARSKTAGEFRLGRDTRTTDTALNGKLNDIRVYGNHCLSAAEVREISQGLVLHYKLDKIPTTITNAYNMTSWNTNATRGGFSAWGPSGHSGTSGNNTDRNYIYRNGRTYSYYISEDAGTGKYFIFYQSPAFEGGYRSLSVIIKEQNGIPIDETVCVPSWNANVTGSNHAPLNIWTHKINLGNGFYLCQVDGFYQNGSNNLVSINVLPGYKIYISEIWLEDDKQISSDVLFPSEQVEDSSGYGNNGIINSNLTMLSETMRYNCSISFDGVDDCIKIPFNDIIKDKNYTVSVWTYKTSIGTKNYQTILGGPSGFELEARSSSSTSPLYRIHNWGGGTTAYEFNKWNLFTFVHTDSNSKLYVNGELKITGTSANIPTGNYYIGAWNSVTGQNYEGLMSDFRIYCTALDADAVRQLYEVSAKIDNKQNLHTFELVEPATRISINKQGQILCNELEETSATKFFKTNQIIETNNLIEL